MEIVTVVILTLVILTLRRREIMSLQCADSYASGID